VGAYVSALRVPKAGSTAEECEDAVAIVPVPEFDEWLTEPLLIAIADGASESLLARDWATLLTRAVLDQTVEDLGVLRDREGFACALANAGKQWAGWLSAYVARREERGQPIAWYEQPKMDMGAYATVIAAHFECDSAFPSRWYAAAMGDSCLFQVRDERMIRTFPIESADDFANVTSLVNSNNQDHTLLASHVRLAHGTAKQGDQFFLCTDALAAWFLREVESAGKPWQTLRNFTAANDKDSFVDWLADMRSQGKLRNDDVVIAHVDLG
jgi:hypothetical protein